MKVISLPVLGAFLIASLGTTAMAGPAMKGAAIGTQPDELVDVQILRHGTPEVADDEIERVYDIIVKSCNDLGGGASSDPDHPGGTECIDPDGKDVG